MDKTLNTDPAQATAQRPLMHHGQHRYPRLMILFHGDLSKVGAVTPPGTFPNGKPVIVGRSGPQFVGVAGAGDHSSSMGDPYVSRKQVVLRWLDEEQRFEVAPVQGASRQVAVVDLGGSRGVTLRVLQGPTQLPAGTVLALGNRMLLLLDVSPWRPRGEDRMGMIGETAFAWRLRDDIRMVARFEKPALILGPTGAGKELVARAIHEMSGRNPGPFVPVNCAAVPEHLAESLLFGHKKGSFTGAAKDNPGVFREAHTGTLFLDELGELPTTLQAKLLRVLQEGTVTPVGSHRPQTVDTRLVAATNRNPDFEIHAGNLRQDFYYRVAAHPIHVPSLAQRRWDVPLLFTHFLQQSRQHHPELGWLWDGQPASRLAMPMTFFMDLLRYDWPGNIRELQNIVEQTVRLNISPGTFQSPQIPGLIMTTSTEGSILPMPMPSGTSEFLPAALAPRPRPRSTPAVYEPNMAGPMGSVPTPPPFALPQNLRASTPTSTPKASGARLRSSAAARRFEADIARRIGMARKTLLRLLDPEGLPDKPEDQSLEAYANELAEKLGADLYNLFVQLDYNQVRIAEHLSVSRTTLIKLMGSFGIPRPQDLTPEQLQKTYTEANGDLEEMARLLKVSPLGLKIHLGRNNLEHMLG